MPPISVVQEITAPDGRAHYVTADGFIVRVVGRPHLTAIKEDSEGFANTWATHDDFSTSAGYSSMPMTATRHSCGTAR